MYYLAHIEKNELITLHEAMSYDEAFCALTVKRTFDTTIGHIYDGIDFLKANYYKTWGIYTYNQAHAHYLAIALGSFKEPQVHGDGYYGHYHDKIHSMHIWFGEKVK